MSAGAISGSFLPPTNQTQVDKDAFGDLNTGQFLNILLTELDRELEKRGHRFVRYADDCNIYVRSERAGQRVMTSVTQFITRRLKLKVNETKSAVARPWERKFLGFSFTNGREPKRRIAPTARQRFKDRVRELTRRTRGISLSVMVKQLAEYLRSGGKVNEVPRGASGRIDPKGPLTPLFTPRSSEDALAGRTPLNDVVAALEARRKGGPAKPPKKKRPRKRVILDDFGQPLRWEWVED